ncbi:MAG: allantoicase [Myxococcales bacterium]|nr:allantoicase [Myxococcales bacterium]
MAEVLGAPALFTGLVDLASAPLGGVVLSCSDDFFAAASCLLRPEPARFDPSTYTDRGKEMDGWESRRKRVPGHDWCIVRLGVPGRVRAVDIDTAHFLGNHGPFASLDACEAPADTTPEALRDSTPWTNLVAETPMKRGSSNVQAVRSDRMWTHVRLNMVPDGGIARLRVYGEPAPAAGSAEVDLAAIESGGVPLVASDSFFSPMTNLVLPGESPIMSNGWETRRSRPPGMDWIILRLGLPGVLSRLTLQTHHFKGNYPDRAAVDALHWPGAPPSQLVDHPDWTEILPLTRLRAHDSRDFNLHGSGPWTHLRLRIVPDGGISRLRAFGAPSTAPGPDPRGLVVHLNGLSAAAAAEALHRACGSRRWVEAMVARRPFQSETQLFGDGDQLWWRLGDGDWREAFSHHPKLGADVAALREKFAATADLSVAEQAGITAASQETLEVLAAGNAAYEARFGMIFIVCAAGLSADAMLDRLAERIDNEPAAELRIAAGEQAKITRLRLARLVEGDAP